jgi:DNA-binding XRE family transcriptional regulator
MRSQAILQLESTTIGDTPRADSLPEPGRVLCGEFGVTSSQPLPGGMPLVEFMRELESDADMVPRLATARRSLADIVDSPGSLRHLRLAAGLSQAKVAELASTTQSYIARLESGTADPGTDMLTRLASALGATPSTVLLAVLAQRVDRRLTSVD